MAQREQLSPRKTPRQRRSTATVDAIVEAAARVFAEGGYGRANTNRIAETAGVSIGSLYEYFPNKDAILVAVAERHLAGMMADVEHLLVAQAQGQGGRAPLEPLLRSFVAELEPAEFRRNTLRGLLAPEVANEDFDAIVEVAEGLEMQCGTNESTADAGGSSPSS